MASSVTHVVFALSMGKAYSGRKMPRRFWVLSAACSVLPDLDAVGLGLGVSYGAFLGHRGFSHSLLFAALVGMMVVYIWFRGVARGGWERLALVAYFFVVTASNGVLDAMTNGGLGVAFLSPFDLTRYFLRWRPLEVSPVNPLLFFSRWGGRVLLCEALWVWIPCILLVVGMGYWRRGAAGRVRGRGR